MLSSWIKEKNGIEKKTFLSNDSHLLFASFFFPFLLSCKTLLFLIIHSSIEWNQNSRKSPWLDDDLYTLYNHNTHSTGTHTRKDYRGSSGSKPCHCLCNVFERAKHDRLLFVAHSSPSSNQYYFTSQIFTHWKLITLSFLSIIINT